MHRIIAHSHIILISCLLIDNACYDYLHANSTECGSSGKYTVCQVCVWVCNVRCAMLLHSKNLLPIQTDRISLVFMFSKFTVAIRIPRITKNTSLILHLYFCFVIISNFFFRKFLVSFWYSFGCVSVCVAKWHSIPLDKD